MLQRAPFMLYVNPPKIDDEDTSNLMENETAIPSTSFIACGALKVLQLLKSKNLPDLDKIVRSQPTILLADPIEIDARINFLYNLFLENTSQSSILSSECVLPLPSSITSNILGIRTISKETNSNLSDVAIFGNRDNIRKSSGCSFPSSSSSSSSSSSFPSSSSVVLKSDNIYNIKSYSKNGSNKDRRSKILTDMVEISVGDTECTGPRSSSSEKSSVIIETESSRRIAAAQRILLANNKNKFNRNDGKESETESVSEDESLSSSSLMSNSHDNLIINGEAINKIVDLNTKSPDLLQHRETAHNMLGTLMLSYPTILSIEHR